ncbi:GAF domain-containing protein [Chloroflexota bacterium]
MTDQAARLLEIQQKAIRSEDLTQLASEILPEFAQLTNADSALLYLHPTSQLDQWGFPTQDIPTLFKLCTDKHSQFSEQADLHQITVPAAEYSQPGAELILQPLRENGGCHGLIGLMQPEGQTPVDSEQWRGCLTSLSKLIESQLARAQLEGQLKHLNTYMTVSSMMSQPLGLHEMLEAALYCCMDASSAQAASVLLLDENKANFHFYQVEGPAKPILEAITFPIGEGIAGSVLESQQPEIVNDVQSDQRFFGKIDSESEFHTQNMIAIPLTAGEEKVGVMEVLNKIDDEDFTDEELFSLMMLAEEIAFAIRNARIFEYVVDSYCLQRQGQNTCRGCKRPLGTWTPCVKYREEELNA